MNKNNNSRAAVVLTSVSHGATRGGRDLGVLPSDWSFACLAISGLRVIGLRAQLLLGYQRTH